MGGKAIDDDFDLEKGLNDLDEFNVTKDAAKAKQLIDDQPPPGSRGGKDDIAAPVQSSEETIKNMIEVIKITKFRARFPSTLITMPKVIKIK